LFVNRVDNYDDLIFTHKVLSVNGKGPPMDHNDIRGEVTASIAETAIYSMLLSQALFEILEEKGLVTRAEVTERMEKLESEAASKMRLPNRKPSLSS